MNRKIPTHSPSDSDSDSDSDSLSDSDSDPDSDQCDMNPTLTLCGKDITRIPSARKTYSCGLANYR